MSSDPRGYQRGTDRALYLLSRGTCYNPDCQEPVMREVEGAQVCLAFIAHIEAAVPNGPRYRASMTDSQRASFPNLLLLCKAHHDFVDLKQYEAIYTVAVLQAWKEERERPLADQLVGLQRLTEATLTNLLEQTANRVIDVVRSSAAELKAQGDEIKDMMAALLEGIIDRPFLDDESIATLAAAAGQLENLGEHSLILHDSATRLNGLGEDSFLLSMAARDLNLPELREVVARLYMFDPLEVVAPVRTATAELDTAAETATRRLEAASADLDEVTRDLKTSPVPFFEIDDPQRMRYFYAGLTLGVGLFMLGLLFYLNVTS